MTNKFFPVAGFSMITRSTACYCHWKLASIFKTLLICIYNLDNISHKVSIGYNSVFSTGRKCSTDQTIILTRSSIYTNNSEVGIKRRDMYSIISPLKLPPVKLYVLIWIKGAMAMQIQLPLFYAVRVINECTVVFW